MPVRAPRRRRAFRPQASSAAAPVTHARGRPLARSAANAVWACVASLIGLALPLPATTPLAAATPILSGNYGPLALAVAEDGSVHGVFAERSIGNGTMDAPQFSCVFLLEGRMEGEVARVDTWVPGWPERIPGELRLGPNPGLQLAGNHGGCLMASGDMKDAPYELDPDERHPEWIGAGIVTGERVVLRPEAAEAPGRARPYLVAYDAVAVLARRPGWVRVAYIEAEGPSPVGWVREDEAAISVAPSP